MTALGLYAWPVSCTLAAGSASCAARAASTWLPARPWARLGVGVNHPAVGSRGCAGDSGVTATDEWPLLASLDTSGDQ